MSVYVLGRIQVIDSAAWAEYRAGVPETLTPWGGELVCRGSGRAVFSEEDRPSPGDTQDAMVVLRFPDRQSAQGWYHSEAYQALLPVRRQAATVELSLYDGE